MKMKSEVNRNPLRPEAASSTNASEAPRVERSGTGEVVAQEHDCPKEMEAPALTDVECSNAAEVVELPPKLDKVLSPSADHEPGPAGSIPSITAEHAQVHKAESFFREQPPQRIEVAPNVLRHRTRRDVLLFGVGAIAALAAGRSLLPQATLERLGVIHGNKTWPRKEWFLNRALRMDDDIAEALYSKDRLVPTYTKSQITPLKNNYNGATPDPGYISEWQLELNGLASGLSVSLNIRNLLTRFQVHEQITRLVCVEGWSAVAWWSGLRFDDLLRAYPPMSQAKWVRLESSVNLDPSGNPDPYFVSLDLPTARHPQTLLATHFNGQSLTVDHGAPLRLLVPVKLGLKNVKAITRITYVAEEPRDYWVERGYSAYDGI
jgi:DMSO/TMAO reductase YedYZ molybdopterin-dependent catalytic subunit